MSEKTKRKSAMTSSVCDMQLFIRRLQTFFLTHASQYPRILCRLSNRQGSLRKKQDKNFKLFFSVKNGNPT